ncbi:hypothetical protein [Winogradskyella sp.]|jgi:hypothetical protein|uniref:hypothetical protein n=1 Tax=Winogradskyella sp. TaxID=1883156 RepID=UPI0025F41CB9|nr:hypothetical protein [Winogradskyella sp.]MCT4629995.1 hypothetical protein [Winogradskyella sp.]
MRLFPLNKNTVALLLVTTVVVGFFAAGMFKVLEYFIVKVLLFLGYGALTIIAFWNALKNDTKKNRPEDKLQDDLH